MPTANQTLFAPGAEEQFFQGTAGHDWRSGQYGCVRSEGRQYHEGMDIRCLQRDRRGEPTDSVLAVADGEVAYVARVAGQSNYGRYVLVRHDWNGVEVFSLYAHLRDIASGLRAGHPVKRGQPIATLGYSGTQNISRDRAHLHFEICFQLNRNFAAWFAPRLSQGDRNDHGNFNGINFQGIDPAAVFLAARRDPRMNFREYMEAQPVAFTVLFPARRAPLSWMRAQTWCIVNGPEPAPVTAYEVWFMAEGVATFVRPRWDVAPAGWTVEGVNEIALNTLAGRPLVAQNGKRGDWTFTQRGAELMEMLSY
ncbi:MAG: M23 family metallopeptidase [Verrucomicrobia bacterium]|nr:M23 family metallopeptidase [Verrucomicrobiota bacterium]